MSDTVQQHYASDGIAERILSAVRATLPPGAPVTAKALELVDHFHSRGIVATKELMALLTPQASEHLLDIGSGVGGPARWIAETYGCRVTGIDLTEAFCAAARKLNAATNLDDRITIIDGNALALPFADNTFDRAYSQNVVMNIADKPAVYREARRVLKPGGVLALSNLAAGPNGDPYYPVPWAQTAATSFLSTPDATRQDLVAAVFDILSFKDTTADVLPAQLKQRQRLESEPPPALGTHLVMGPRMAELQINSIRGLADGRLTTIEALVRKRF